MAKVINFVWGEPAYGILRYIFEKNNISQKIILFSEELSIGYLEKKFSERRVKSLIEIYKKSDYFNYNEEDYIKDTKDIYLKISDIKNEKIIIWVSNNINEKLMLEFLCSVFKNEIYLIDLRKEKSIKAISQLSPNFLKKYIGKEKLLSHLEKEELSKDYESHIEKEKLLRINGEKGIEDVNIDYFDEYILNKINKKEKFSFKEIGEIMGELLEDFQLLSEVFILSRINELKKENKIKSKLITR